MRKTAQAWFSGGPTNDLQKAPSSLLADWNAYAASRASEDSEASSGLGFDVEAAVRTANDKVSGTFNVVSRGVRDLPGNFQSATSNVPTGKSLIYFALLLASGVFFIILAFSIFLPVMVIKPQKFAICFTIGCAFIIGSFFALKGPRSQLAHMSSKERLPFTLGFIGSSIGTVYVSMVLHSYILSVFFSFLQLNGLGPVEMQLAESMTLSLELKLGLSSVLVLVGNSGFEKWLPRDALSKSKGFSNL